MEMCVKIRSFDVARRINSYMHIRKMHYAFMSARNSAASQRNDDRLSCLEVRRHRGAGLCNEKGVTLAPLRIEHRCSSTSLYTPPAEGENVPFVLKPELEFNALLRDEEKFEKSIEARNMEVEGINIPEMVCCILFTSEVRIAIEFEPSSVQKENIWCDNVMPGDDECDDDIMEMR